MNQDSDQQLLRDYAERRSEAAFAELVQRHIDFVYSTALRMVRNPQFAEDVAQGVFVVLGQNARRLTDRAVLSGWLHRTTQNLAAKAVRTEVRRRAREQEAIAMNELSSSQTDPVWERIVPHLDAALGKLNEADRDAVLLRYFQGKSAREIAQTLDLTEDAAQKRVSRALEKLRTQFTRRGVTISSAAIAAALVTHSTQAAPAGLAAAISSAALGGTAITTAATTTATITKVIAMTTTQKVLIAVATAGLAITAGTSVYQTQRVSQVREQLVALQQQQEPLMQQVEQLRRERDEAQKQIAQLRRDNADLPRLRGEVTRLQANAQELAQLKAADSEKPTGGDTQKETDPAQSAENLLVAKVKQLKQRLAQMPGARIPEFHFLTDDDWLNAAKGKLETDEDYRSAFALLRSLGEGKFGHMAQQALTQYMQANSGQFPTDLSQLQAYFTSPVDDAILQRYKIAPAASFPTKSLGGDWIITQKAPVDENYDLTIGIGPNGYGVNSPMVNMDAIVTSPAILVPALKAFAAANNGEEPTDPSQLLPYATTSAQQAAIQKLIQSLGTNNVQQGSASIGQ